ncbi:MAG: glucosidase [Phycisphaerales bacterium]|nr:glucosidase [Phycisphaerales bacterium]
MPDQSHSHDRRIAGATHHDPEAIRLAADVRREQNWKRWGPYLAERQWGTVREDYSADGDCWNALPHDHARSRAYRWGEDGLLGICDRQCRLCLALALWNERDPILKERLFGLTNPEGNHGEDVKECYYYLDSTPTHSWMRALYKYPQAAFPYERLLDENRRRTAKDREFELEDTGVFDDDRYFDVEVRYAKGAPDDLLMVVAISNRGPDPAPIHVLPTLWFRNTWSWGRTTEDYNRRPTIVRHDERTLRAEHATLGQYALIAGDGPNGRPPTFLFTENDTDNERIFGSPNGTPFVKDAFHEAIVHGRSGATNPAGTGTKAAAHYRLEIAPGESVQLCLRLGRTDELPMPALGAEFARTLAVREEEANAFYDARLGKGLDDEQRRVARQAYAGLLWSKQFYHYSVSEWLDGDPAQPKPPAERLSGRNADWRHLYNRDVISMPDKWEYPWYAAWDLAFHMIPFAQIDPEFAKDQLLLLMREWYMHANGQLPAYEFAFGDVNPPVHAWACWRVYKMTGPRGARDRAFLQRAFHKLLINFTWWVNRKDVAGKHVFSGGFLGLDNIGVFDRSRPLPTGGHLEQADGTAWMAFFCLIMLAIALELAVEDPAYEDVASKFFEHFVAIVDAMNALGGTGLWDEQDGFYYDKLNVDGQAVPLRVRSIVGLIPLFAAAVLEDEMLERLPGFAKRTRWFLEHRTDLARHIAYMDVIANGRERADHLLAIPSRERLERVLEYLLDESEFLSPCGIRSVSRHHLAQPYVFSAEGEDFTVAYEPGESTTGMFGGNSNWRGPIWMPINYLLIEALERYHYFYGDTLKVECPIGSGRMMNLEEVAGELRRRLASIFLRGEDGRRPCHGDAHRYANDPHWRDLVLFHEHFDGDTGRGLGASHQTGWTALIAPCMEDIGRTQAALVEDGGQAKPVPPGGRRGPVRARVDR